MLRNTVDRHTVYDVVVVGAGATGAWTAKQLAEARLRVALLDAGPSIGEASGAASSAWNDEQRRAAARRQPVQSQHPAYWLQNPQHFVDDFEHPYTFGASGPFYWIRGRQVGGRTLTWGGVTLRFSDHELRAQDFDGSLPSWPLSYRDLEPWYAKVESYLGIHGERDDVEALPDGVFVPPPPLTSLEQRFKGAVQAHWPERPVVACRGVDENGAVREGADTRWPRKSMLHRVLPDALRTGQVDIRPDAIAAELILDRKSDQVKAVRCIDRNDFTSFEVRGRIVVLCASTIETVRLMLNSKSSRAPRGLGNSSGQLGAFLMDHAVAWAIGVVPDAARTAAPVAPRGHGLLVPRFQNLRARDRDYLRGYGLWATIGARNWGEADLPMWALCAMLEVLPAERNRIEIDESSTDSWGISVPRIGLTYSSNELKMFEDAQAMIGETCNTLGWPAERRGRMSPGTFSHELGGARMGDDPARSIVNASNQCWDVKNLFVLDGACFVTSGWQNPTLTMMAIAARGSDFIIRERAQGHL